MMSFATVNRKVRSAREFVRGLTHTAHPLLVQIVPIRRCNIDCGYCNEYDKVSPPVSTEAMLSRIDKLGDLGTAGGAFTGGGAGVAGGRGADAAPRPRCADPPHSQPRHDGGPHHQWLLPCAEAHR